MEAAEALRRMVAPSQKRPGIWRGALLNECKSDMINGRTPGISAPMPALEHRPRTRWPMSRDKSTSQIRTRRVLLPLQTGAQIGRWTLLGPAENAASGHKRWLCRCECGTERIQLERNLRPNRGQEAMSLSCGCWRSDRISANSTIHGHCKPGARSPEFICWTGIVMRCTNPNGTGYERYGARGITVCARWRDSFSDFLSDMGTKPSPRHQIDRQNNDGGYWCGRPDCPECGPLRRVPNCRWVTPSENLNNTSANVRLEHDGKTMTIAEWSRATGIKWTTIRERLKRGWSASEALTRPIDQRCYRKSNDASE